MGSFFSRKGYSWHNSQIRTKATWASRPPLPPGPPGVEVDSEAPPTVNCKQYLHVIGLSFSLSVLIPSITSTRHQLKVFTATLGSDGKMKQRWVSSAYWYTRVQICQPYPMISCQYYWIAWVLGAPEEHHRPNTQKWHSCNISFLDLTERKEPYHHAIVLPRKFSQGISRQFDGTCSVCNLLPLFVLLSFLGMRKVCFFMKLWTMFCSLVVQETAWCLCWAFLCDYSAT